jgi:hypothetical protein
MNSAIAGKKLVAVTRLDYPERGVGPSESIIGIRKRRLSLAAGFETLLRRGNDDRPSH